MKSKINRYNNCANIVFGEGLGAEIAKQKTNNSVRRRSGGRDCESVGQLAKLVLGEGLGVEVFSRRVDEPPREVHAVGDVDSSVAVDLRTLAEINMAADVRALHAQPGGVQHRLKTPPCPHDAKAALVSRHQSNLAGSEIRCGGFVVAGFVGH